MDYQVLKKCFLAFYERAFSIESKIDIEYLNQLVYQLQVVGVSFNDGYGFTLANGEVDSLDLKYSLINALETKNEKLAYFYLSDYANSKIVELQKLRDEIVFSEINQSFSREELEEKRYILNWMKVLNATHYMKQNLFVDEAQIITDLNHFHPYPELNHVALKKVLMFEEILNGK